MQAMWIKYLDQGSNIIPGLESVSGVLSCCTWIFNLSQNVWGRPMRKTSFKSLYHNLSTVIICALLELNSRLQSLLNGHKFIYIIDKLLHIMIIALDPTRLLKLHIHVHYTCITWCFIIFIHLTRVKFALPEIFFSYLFYQVNYLCFWDFWAIMVPLLYPVNLKDPIALPFVHLQ